MKKILALSFTILLITSIYLSDNPSLSDDSIEYTFNEKQDFEISNLLKSGVNIVYIDGHFEVNYVWIMMKNFPEIEIMEVHKDNDELIILIEDKKGTTKKDRMFTSSEVEGLYEVMDNIKVYRNGKRYYLIHSTEAKE